MRLFTSEKEAIHNFNSKRVFWLNSKCAFDSSKMCSTKCALCYVNIDPETDKPTYVILGCKGTDKKLFANVYGED